MSLWKIGALSGAVLSLAGREAGLMVSADLNGPAISVQ